MVLNSKNNLLYMHIYLIQCLVIVCNSNGLVHLLIHDHNFLYWWLSERNQHNYVFKIVHDITVKQLTKLKIINTNSYVRTTLGLLYTIYNPALYAVWDTVRLFWACMLVYWSEIFSTCMEMIWQHETSWCHN